MFSMRARSTPLLSLLLVACTKATTPDADAGPRPAPVGDPPVSTPGAPAAEDPGARTEPGPPAGPGGADELHRLEGRSEAALLGELGPPDRKHAFVMADCCNEFEIELYNTYPPAGGKHAQVEIRQWTWQYDGYALTVWLHRVNEAWTVLETSRYSDDTEF